MLPERLMYDPIIKGWVDSETNFSITYRVFLSRDNEYIQQAYKDNCGIDLSPEDIDEMRNMILSN